jgi:hypothetical protein
MYVVLPWACPRQVTLIPAGLAGKKDIYRAQSGWISVLRIQWFGRDCNSFSWSVTRPPNASLLTLPHPFTFSVSRRCYHPRGARHPCSRPEIKLRNTNTSSFTAW